MSPPSVMGSVRRVGSAVSRCDGAADPSTTHTHTHTHTDTLASPLRPTRACASPHTPRGRASVACLPSRVQQSVALSLRSHRSHLSRDPAVAAHLVPHPGCRLRSARACCFPARDARACPSAPRPRPRPRPRPDCEGGPDAIRPRPRPQPPPPPPSRTCAGVFFEGGRAPYQRSGERLSALPVGSGWRVGSGVCACVCVLGAARDPLRAL
jgi:hypothetical protein